MLAGRLAGQGATPSLTLLTRDGRRTLALSVQSDQEFVALDDLAAAFQLAVRDESGAVSVSYKGRTIVLTPDQTIASVAGRMISLPARPVRSGGRLLVPVDFVSRAGDMEKALSALGKASGFLRNELRQSLRMRHTPELVFRSDVGLEHSERIHTLLAELRDRVGLPAEVVQAGV